MQNYHEGQRFPTSAFLSPLSYEVVAESQINENLAFEPDDDDERSAKAKFFRNLVQSIQIMLAQESARGIGFLLMPIALSIGIISYFSMNFEPNWFSLCFALASLALIFIAGKKNGYLRYIAIFALMVCLGFVVAKYHTSLRPLTMLGSNNSTKITGEVHALSTVANGSYRLDIIVHETSRPALRYPPAKIKVTARDLPAQIQLGDFIEGIVRLRPPSGPVRPDNYDFAFNNFFQGNDASGFFLGTPTIIPKPSNINLNNKVGIWSELKDFVANLRFKITESIQEHLRGENGAIAAALITGYRGGITEKTNEALRDAGLAHVLSISGLHLALAAGVMMMGIRGLASFFQGLSTQFPFKKIAAFAALLSSAFYLGISGADIAAQRSFVMVAILLISIIFDRSAISMRNLCIAALIILIISPNQILGPSFQMSFAATAALIAVYAWWSEQKKYKSEFQSDNKENQTGRAGWVFSLAQKAIIGTAVTSIAAGIASGIFAAYHFNNTAPLGLVGNILAMPIVSILIMPFAVLSVLLMPIYLEWLPLQIMGFGISLMKSVAYWVASIAPAGNPGIMTSFTLSIFSLGLVIAVITTTKLRLLAIPVVAIGLLSFVSVKNPDLIISEDAKLVAVLDKDNNLAVNQARGSQFTINNWQKSYKIKELVKPSKAETPNSDATKQAFFCEENMCVYQLNQNRLLAYTDDPHSVEIICNIADIAILAVPAKDAICETSTTFIITRQELALKGALEIRLSKSWLEKHTAENVKNQPIVTHASNLQIPTISKYEADIMSEEGVASGKVLAPTILPVKVALTKKLARDEIGEFKYAVGTPQRPWQLYRLYSRAARGLPDY